MGIICGHGNYGISHVFGSRMGHMPVVGKGRSSLHVINAIRNYSRKWVHIPSSGNWVHIPSLMSGCIYPPATAIQKIG